MNSDHDEEINEETSERKEMLSDLVKRRGIVKSRLTKLRTFFESINQEALTDKIINELQLRSNRVKCVFDEFNELQDKIDLLLELNEPDDQARDEFEANYYDIFSNIGSCIKKYEVGQDAASSFSQSPAISQVQRQNISCVKLPPVKIPNFEGDIENWLEFKDSFTALVHNNSDLADIPKFIYLRNCLDREALQIIKSIEVSQSNYQTAWQALLDRFENKKLIIHSHIQAILDQPKLNRESPTELRNLYDNVTKHLRCLDNLGENTENWERLIIHIMASKFDSITRRDWESFDIETELPTMNDLNRYLKSRCELLEKIALTRVDKLNSRLSTISVKSKSFMATNNGVFQCYVCGGNHSIYKCKKLLDMNVDERIKEVKRLGLCLNCLKNTHQAWKCKDQPCFKCKNFHNRLLHREIKPATVGNTRPGVLAEGQVITNSQNQRSQETSGGSVNVHTTREIIKTITNSDGCKHNFQVLLSTAVIGIKCGDRIKTCRCLLDSGSMSNFISNSACEKLGIEARKIKHIIQGVGQTTTNIDKEIFITFESLYNSNFHMSINCFVLPCITQNLPMISFDRNSLDIPRNLRLADSNFNESKPIDILLGAAVFWEIMLQRRNTLKSGLILQETQLGYVLGGPMTLFHCGNRNIKAAGNMGTNCLSINQESLINQQIVKFWQLEEVENKNIFSEDQRFCEEYFKKTTKRDETGRFIVNIPFRENLIDLGESKQVALQRFDMLEKKLHKNNKLREEYIDFMREYQELNHMVEIDTSEINNLKGYFLAHHAVIKKDSITSHCRVVFDASARTSTGLSLNDVQFVGPKLQRDIFDILIRFRRYAFVMTSDISKMYRQILVNENDRKYQKVFWRAGPEDQLKVFEINRITYGMASAPYLAVRCLFELANENENLCPLAVKAIREEFYMDDLLSGADSESELLIKQREVTQILASAGFELRKWLSNKRELLKKFVINDHLKVSVLELGENEQNKTLGVFWDSTGDNFKYCITEFLEIENLTKRKILSMICQVFDPLGILGPIIIIAKLVIQELWRRNFGWDDEVPENIHNLWKEFLQELPLINTYLIPRHCLNLNSMRIELHGFCDSSERAYGSCIYIRCISFSGKIMTKILCAKSRVAPLKQVSLPRLELCGALLLANLAHRVIKSLEVEFSEFFFWTDSLIVLSWIKGEPIRWKTFVANRESEIHNLTNKNNWHYVKGVENPADLLSRGVTPSGLKENDLWWHGPDFLSRTLCFETEDESLSKDDIPERRNISVTTLSVNENDMLRNLIDKFSSFRSLVRVLAYIKRFCMNCKQCKEDRNVGNLTAAELDESEICLLKYVQKENFKVEYNELKKNQELHKKSKILSLHPFIKFDLIRVGGRIRHCAESFDRKHPILLPKSRLTELIIQDLHERSLHCGVQALLSIVREKYWPISARNMCKKIVRKCMRCFRAKPPNTNYLMGDLPDVRVYQSLPFTNVGTDFGGPFLIKDKKSRGAKSVKVYLCLFICMSVKAVHLEIVSELTTEAFLAALKRFVSRRGRPSNLYSDNGTNYVGANNELLKIYDFLKVESKNISGRLAEERIRWHFIPAASPNFGGLWEAGIKSVKFHIKRVMGNSLLTFEEFMTLLTQIEAVLNSRPLIPLTSDPSDLTALAPSHFLIGRNLLALPELNLVHLPENRLSKWQRLQAMLQHYWRRWSKEYLSELQQRVKWKYNSSNLLKVGVLVLIKNDNSNVLDWQLGRVIKLHPGGDGVVRVADVQVRDKVLTRAVSRLCALPIED